MADKLVQMDSEEMDPEELAKPGLLGRAIRAGLGLATVGWLVLLLLVSPPKELLVAALEARR